MREAITTLLTELVAIDSVNPSLVPGGAGEAAAADLVAAWAADAGLEVQRLEATPGRPSVVVTARGTGGGRTLLLCGHLDVVGVDGMAAPFEPRIDGDRLYGRGAYDMKGGLVAALVACREAASLGLAGDVVVAAVADEEHASLGVQEALEAIAATVDAAIVTEPTEHQVVVAHKGFVWGEIEVVGRAAHGSMPELGVDAIVKAGPILTALGELDRALGADEHPLLGRGSIHASLISGGIELSSYPERCRIGIERRTLPGEDGATLQAELDAILSVCRGADPALQASARTTLERQPFAIDPDAEIARLVAGAGGGERIGEPYWTDAAFIAAAGIPACLYGPSGAGAHATEEWVSLSSCETVARALVDVAARFSAG